MAILVVANSEKNFNRSRIIHLIFFYIGFRVRFIVFMIIFQKRKTNVSTTNGNPLQCQKYFRRCLKNYAYKHVRSEKTYLKQLPSLKRPSM